MGKKKEPIRIITINRDTITGRIVTKEETKRRPKTTVTEHYPIFRKTK